MISNSQSLVASIKNRINRGTAFAPNANKYSLAPDMTRDREINLSYVTTAEMLANCFTKLLLKQAFLKQCAVMGIVLATVPVLDPAGFIGLCGNGLTLSKIDDCLSEPSL
jgi:hypothetical protein